jgi:hypothetical protein
MMAHELAHILLDMPDGVVILDVDTDVRDDEIMDTTAYGAYESVYSGEPAVEISTRHLVNPYPRRT